MADQLSSSIPGHNGIQILKGIDQAKFLTWLDEMRELDQQVASVTADRKKKLAVIKAELGGDDEFQAFQRARKDADMSGEARERRELAYRRMMFWQSKPVGWQASMDLQSEDEDIVAVNVHELKRIDHLGEAAGKNGQRRDANPYTPGTEYAQRWDSAWLRGQAAIAATLAPDGQQPRRRGRPPGSRNKPKTVEQAEQQLDADDGDGETAGAPEHQLH